MSTYKSFPKKDHVKSDVAIKLNQQQNLQINI